jgi:hypothetical protein
LVDELGREVVAFREGEIEFASDAREIAVG